MNNNLQAKRESRHVHYRRWVDNTPGKWTVARLDITARALTIGSWAFVLLAGVAVVSSWLFVGTGRDPMPFVVAVPVLTGLGLICIGAADVCEYRALHLFLQQRRAIPAHLLGGER